MDISRLLIMIGAVAIVIGPAWPLISKRGRGRPPGDIVIERGNCAFHFPFVTCLVISALPSLIPWLVNR
jgi:DUF2905 family protein